jgi:glycosyltransferase involved in cell wall biosynthesis
MNVAAFSAINKIEPVHYVGPINPPVISWQKAISKVRRIAGSQGAFFFFSESRLKKVAEEIHFRSHTDAHLDFFHGFTPWILTRPRHPYMAWSDCTFRDYIDIFHRREQFSPEDLVRIEQAEASWLRDAQFVLFTSEWAVERAVSAYGLDASRVASVGIFGEMEMPAHDSYAGRKEFAFVSTNFEAKGGLVVLAAFREVKRLHPDASLVIVGDRPYHDVSEPGVRCKGFLRKEVPEEYQRFREILGGARAIVSATSSDICPLLFVEAGYFGCPVISSRRFAIPEIVDDRSTGFLLDDSPNSSALASAMSRMLESTDEYWRMREAAWSKARGQHSRERFEERLCLRVSEVIERSGLADKNVDVADIGPIHRLRER